MQLGLGFPPAHFHHLGQAPNSNSITCLDWAPTQAQIFIFSTTHPSERTIILEESLHHRRHQETLPPSPTTGAAIHLAGAGQDAPCLRQRRSC